MSFFCNFNWDKVFKLYKYFVFYFVCVIDGVYVDIFGEIFCVYGYCNFVCIWRLIVFLGNVGVI